MVQKCRWSVDGICRCFVIRYGKVHPHCDGIHPACIQGKLDLVDPRFSQLRHPGWGGRRSGAGAPKGNLNAIKHGARSGRLLQLYREEARIRGAIKRARERQASRGEPS